jgi:trehalose-phosphatase
MPAAPRHLFACWSEVARRLRSAPGIALFLDFDGTLSPLCPRPEQVRLSSATRRVVSTLAGQPGVRLWVISGRRQSDVRGRIRIAGVHYLGLHGWEGRQSVSVKAETRKLLENLKARARQSVQATSATWLEDKDVVLTIHHASASAPDILRVRQEISKAILPLNGLFRGTPGERSFELAPAEMGDKGTAVRREWAFASPTALPVFVGDDVVDEPAFIALAEGITIRVGRSRQTRAHFWLSNVAQVRTFLERLNKEVRCIQRRNPFNSPLRLI